MPEAEEALEVVEGLVAEMKEAIVDLGLMAEEEVHPDQGLMEEAILTGQGHMGVLIVLAEEVLTGQVQDFVEDQGNLNTGQEQMEEADLGKVHMEDLSFQEDSIRINYF